MWGARRNWGDVGCSAGYCPMTQQGSHTQLDPICPRLPAKWIKDFPKNYKGAGSSEVIAAVTRIYDKTVGIGNRLGRVT